MLGAAAASISSGTKEVFRRVRKLYLPPRGRYFGCRQCHDLTYTSCQESHKDDRAYRMLAGRTGYTPAEVKEVFKLIGKRGAL